MIDVVILSAWIRCVSPDGSHILQLKAFQVSVSVPSPVGSVRSPSSADPSPLQNGIARAMTIQFPHWITQNVGSGGSLPDTLDTHWKHMAAPTPSVSVGVTKIRILFVGSHPVPMRPPGDGGQQTHAPIH